MFTFLLETYQMYKIQGQQTRLIGDLWEWHMTPKPIETQIITIQMTRLLYKLQIYNTY